VEGEGQRVKRYLIKTSEPSRARWLETQLICFDENELNRESDSRTRFYIGSVYQVPHGPKEV
jgi:hypothetical protein